MGLRMWQLSGLRVAREGLGRLPCRLDPDGRPRYIPGMASNTADSLEGPARKSGWPIGWIVLSWAVVGLAAYWFATWLNRSDAPAPVPAIVPPEQPVPPKTERGV